MKPLFVLILAFAASAVCAQGAYRWVGKDGKVHYSDEPPPPAAAQKVEQRRLGANVIAGGGTLSYEMRQAAKNFPLVLYTTADCGAACTSAQAHLRKRGVPFSDKVLGTQEDIAAFRKAAGIANPGVPALMIGSKLQQGFDESGWDGVLQTAGYPIKP